MSKAWGWIVFAVALVGLVILFFWWRKKQAATLGAGAALAPGASPTSGTSGANAGSSGSKVFNLCQKPGEALAKVYGVSKKYSDSRLGRLGCNITAKVVGEIGHIGADIGHFGEHVGKDAASGVAHAATKVGGSIKSAARHLNPFTW